jgi:hypothetical protein
MTTLRKLIVAAIAATALLALTAGAANALRSISINEKSIHVVWEELSFAEPVFGLSIICPVTIRIVFSEDKISKRATEIGNVVEVRVAETSCTNGRARPLTEGLPWVVLYNGFTGTLPEILTIRLILRKTAFLLTTPIGTCLYEGEAEGITTIGARRITGLRAGETKAIRLLRLLTGSCASTGRFKGTGKVLRLSDLREDVEIFLI